MERALEPPDSELAAGRDVANIDGPVGRPRALGPRALGRLVVGSVSDPAEREADALAAEVLRTLTEGTAAPALAPPAPAGTRIRRAVTVPDPVVSPAAGTGADGGRLDEALDGRIRRSMGGGRRLEPSVQTRLQRAFGTDLSAVRLHTDREAGDLSRGINARAFTVGSDVFFGEGEFRPNTAGGMELLAHELAHVEQQPAATAPRPSTRRTAVGRIQPRAAEHCDTDADAGERVRRAGGHRSGVVRRVWTPHTLDDKTTLRATHGANVAAATKLGTSMPKGTEIVVDPAQQDVTQEGLPGFRRPARWDRAVNVNGATFDPAVHKTAGGYVRHAKVTPSVYPKVGALTVDVMSRGRFTLDVQFHEDIGEYAVFEASVVNPAHQIVRQNNNWHLLTAPGVLAPLTATELTQVDDVSRDHAIDARLRVILTTAANTGGIAPALLLTAHNINNLKKPLRADQATGGQAEQDKWFAWSQNVFAKIQQGADEVVTSVLGWRSEIYPADVTQVGITAIEVEGSDLHDHGLGALFVTYTKPADDTGMFPNVPSVKVVIKPEQRVIEQALFGHEPTSLASHINTDLNLPAASAITTIKMVTHPTFGSLIEFVQGTLAKHMNDTGADTQAMSEAIAFTVITGMSDVHRDNVIWNNGKPYFIDADNSLNESILGQHTRGQSGFTENNSARATTDTDLINNAKGLGSRSVIVQAMRRDPQPIIDRVTAAFTGRRGRIVPFSTNTWANHFKPTFGYIEKDDGVPTDLLATGQFTRWGLANQAALKLIDGGPTTALHQGPGLRGECGEAAAGGQFNAVAEGQQIKSDLDSGKVPFYEYEYSTGHVLHNGQVIWHGQTIADAMVKVLARFT